MLELQLRPYTMCRAIGAWLVATAPLQQHYATDSREGDKSANRGKLHILLLHVVTGPFTTDKRMKPQRKHFGSGLTERSNRHVR
jgi:hypothetical protein